VSQKEHGAAFSTMVNFVVVRCKQLTKTLGSDPKERPPRVLSQTRALWWTGRNCTSAGRIDAIQSSFESNAEEDFDGFAKSQQCDFTKVTDDGINNPGFSPGI
jgi:hypothetical protein